MPTVYFSPIGNGQTFFNTSGQILSGGTINTYVAGSTTPIATYTDNTGTVANANPIVLNSAGQSNNEIWLTAATKFIVKDSLGNIIQTIDNIPAINNVSTTVNEWVASGLTPTYISTSSFSLVGDQTLNFTSARRLKIVVTAGTVYGYIRAASFGSGVTTITVSLDSGSLDSGISSVSYSFTDPTHTSISNQILDINNFRLTLTSGLPVTTADVTSATTVYCTPYNGNQIALYNGTNWNIRTSAEFSLALGTLTANLPYDVFCYDNAGVPTLELLAWTSTSARATALAYQDGRLVKSGAATRRYLGSFYTTSTTTTEDSEANRYLFNYYHRKPKPMRVKTTAASWTIANTVTTFIQANSSTVYQLNCLVGVVEDLVNAEVHTSYSTAAGTGSLVLGIGINSTSVSVAPYGRAIGTTAYGSAHTSYKGFPVLGLNNITWLNMGNSLDTVTVVNYNAGNWQSQMQGEVWL